MDLAKKIFDKVESDRRPQKKATHEEIVQFVILATTALQNGDDEDFVRDLAVEMWDLDEELDYGLIRARINLVEDIKDWLEINNVKLVSK